MKAGSLSFLFHFQSILHPENVVNYRKSVPQSSVWYVQSFKDQQKHRAIVRNELPISGLDSTDVYTYKGALLPVELSRRHPQIVVCSSPGRAGHTYLDIVAQATCC